MNRKKNMLFKLKPCPCNRLSDCYSVDSALMISIYQGSDVEEKTYQYRGRPDLEITQLHRDPPMASLFLLIVSLRLCNKKTMIFEKWLIHGDNYSDCEMVHRLWKNLRCWVVVWWTWVLHCYRRYLKNETATNWKCLSRQNWKILYKIVARWL